MGILSNGDGRSDWVGRGELVQLSLHDENFKRRKRIGKSERKHPTLFDYVVGNIKEVNMASGCDFTCDNEKCMHHKKGIVLTAPWPLGQIEKIIMAKNVKINREFQARLINLHQKVGRKYACIIFPNVNKIPIVGYRVNMWCDKCKYIGTYDIMIDPYEQGEKNGDEISNILEKAILDSKVHDNTCPTCNGKMKTFSQLMEENDGIDCPHCKVKMTKNTFFSNETSEEFIKNA